ncbi:MAG: hypothetical protein IT372_04215 [Polyangiaceae bacterium]|nr:hypothetical protein [Polyangiaceae bacterium]
MHRSALTAPVAALLIALAASPALAQPAGEPPPAPPETAEQIRGRARAALTGGDVTAACVLFEQAFAFGMREGTDTGVFPTDILFDLAECHARQGLVDVAATELDGIAGRGGPRAEEARARAAELRKPPAAPPAPPLAAPPKAPPAKQDGPALSGVAPPEGRAGVRGRSAAGRAEPPSVERAAPSSAVGPADPTRIGDFMDTRLTWTFGDDDVLHSTGEALPLSPNAAIGDRKQYRLFFDNLNSRFGGRENLTHLALYKKMPAFIKDLDTEASLVLRFDIAALAKNANNVNQALYDSGSFIRAFYHLDGKPDGKTGLGVTFWPLDTDRFRLGYLYDISWGGTNASINQSIFPRLVGSSPGAKIQFDHDRFSVYAGFKTAQIIQVQEVLTPGTSEVEEIRIGETNYGFLGGAGVDITENLHADVGAGYFQQGKFDLPDVAGEPVYTYGFSGRVVVHHKDMPVPQSIDFQLYRNDPNKPQIIFKPETYEAGKTTWAISLEGSNLSQHLKDFEAAGSTAIQDARAAALQGNMKSGFFRLSLTGIYRDLPFVLRNQPSFIPFQTIPEGGGSAEATDELFFAAAADYFVEAAHLTPGIGVGLQVPATFKSITTHSASAPIERTVVVREQGNIAILPANKAAVPILQARFSLKWDISRILSAIGWVQYVRDNNGTFVERDPSEGTTSLRTFIKPDFLGFGTSVQARF